MCTTEMVLLSIFYNTSKLYDFLIMSCINNHPLCINKVINHQHSWRIKFHVYNRDSAAFNFYIDGSANQSILRPQKNVTCLNICVYLIYDCSNIQHSKEILNRRRGRQGFRTLSVHVFGRLKNQFLRNNNNKGSRSNVNKHELVSGESCRDGRCL